ncbi:CaiB/BaiF CoA-transferase family protein [Agreia bicolorata]|nr:CoA transferase [Agreia bicolorata]
MPNPIDLPLAGIRVVAVIDGPLQSVGRLLADLGADVVRVEPPSGSSARRAGILLDDTSLTFALKNANTRSITHSGHDTAVLRAELATADIFVFDSLLLSEQDLAGLNPRLVAVSLTDFGLSGPRSSWIGTPDVHLALSSALSRSGLPEIASPLLPPAFLASEAAAAQAVWVILLAYLNAVRLGHGDFVDFSTNEALVQILDPGFGIGGSARAGESVADVPRGRPDARHLYPIFPAKDGWVRICVLAKRQWRGMFEWLGQPEQFADPKYDSTPERFKASRTLYPLIGALFANKTQAEIVEEGQNLGVPTAAILSASQVLDTPAYRSSGSLVSTTLVDKNITVPHGWFEIDGERIGYRTPAPGIGADDGILRVHEPASFPVAAGSGRPFDGLRVLDLGVIVVGAEIGRLFADYGADVIKIESTSFPDGSRQADTLAAVAESSAWGHRNKRSLGLNLKSENGKRIFRELVAKSDVVLTNFKPGTMDSLGFGYESLAAINPGIIVSESSAFGNNGPWSSRLGYGPLVRASAGLSALWSYPDIPGSFSDAITIFPDHVVARLNAAAVVALLFRRYRSGVGGRVSTAQVDAILNAMADALAQESHVTGSIFAQGNTRGIDAPRGLFPSSGDDEWVVVDPIGDEQFRALAVTIGHAEWLDDERFIDAASRLSHATELDAAVRSWTESRTPVEAANVLQAAGVPAGAMARVADLVHDEHLSARGVFSTLQQPGFPTPLPTGLAEAVSRSLPQPRLAPAPRMAENTRALMAELFELSHDDIDALIATGDLEEHPAVAEVRTAQTA